MSDHYSGASEPEKHLSVSETAERLRDVEILVAILETLNPGWFTRQRKAADRTDRQSGSAK